jgi:hypothetical protein
LPRTEYRAADGGVVEERRREGGKQAATAVRAAWCDEAVKIIEAMIKEKKEG